MCISSYTQRGRPVPDGLFVYKAIKEIHKLNAYPTTTTAAPVLLAPFILSF